MHRPDPSPKSTPLIFVATIAAIFVNTVSALPAHAQASPQGAPPMYMQLVPFVFLFVVMYFLMIRPQARRQKQKQEFLAKLKRGDEVLTSSGLLGRIEGLTEAFVTLEVAPGVRIKVVRNAIESPVPTAVSATEVKA